MKQKYSLTAEHRSQLDGWAKKWIANAMSTRPMDDEDREKMVRAIHGLYRAAALPLPRRIVFVPSPFVLCFAGGAAAWWWYVLHNGPSATDGVTDDATNAATSAATRIVTSIATFVVTSVATSAATDGATNAATAATSVASRDATSIATDDATNAATSAVTSVATFVVTRDATSIATDGATSAAIRDATHAISAATFVVTDGATRVATDDATRIATFAAIDGATDGATSAATNAATFVVTRDATTAATDGATTAATTAATSDATRDAISVATFVVTDGATRDVTDGATTAATFVATDGATNAATAAISAATDAISVATRDATDGATDDVTDNRWYQCGVFPKIGQPQLECARKAYRMWQGGNQWSALDSFLSFFHHVARLNLPEYEAYQHWEAAAIHGGPRIMHPDFVMVSDRPCALKVDELNRPHCDEGPFCQWRDGSRLYAIHGVFVPMFVVENPKKITIDRIKKETNAEVRRVMIERMGLGKYLWESKAELVDADHEKCRKGAAPRALVRDYNGDQWLVGTDGGTKRVYHMPVPREVKTCREAHVAICGFDESRILSKS